MMYDDPKPNEPVNMTVGEFNTLLKEANAFKRVLERVRILTERDLEHKSMAEIVLSAAEEFGEFCRELKIEEGVFGNSHKQAGPDGTVGEAIDMAIMAFALYYATHANPEQATAQILERMTVKLDKWDANQQREVVKLK